MKRIIEAPDGVVARTITNRDYLWEMAVWKHNRNTSQRGTSQGKASKEEVCVQLRRLPLDD